MRRILCIVITLICLVKIAECGTASDATWYDKYFNYLERLFGISSQSEYEETNIPTSPDHVTEDLPPHGGSFSEVRQDSIYESPNGQTTDRLRAQGASHLEHEVLNSSEDHFTSQFSNSVQSCDTCPNSGEPSLLRSHPFINIANITRIECNEYIIIKFTLDPEVFEETFSCKVSNYDVVLLNGKSMVEIFQILPPFPLIGEGQSRRRHHEHIVTFYPWNAERLPLDRDYFVQVRLLGPTYHRVVDQHRGIFLSSSSEPFRIPKCSK